MKFIRGCLKTKKHLCYINFSLSLALQLIVVTLGSEHEGDDPLEWLRHSVPGIECEGWRRHSCKRLLNDVSEMRFGLI